MPVVAVVAAVASFVEGVSVFAAATTIAGEVIGGAMALGGALTIAGTISGNQNLVKWGSILSIAGGIGDFATSVLSNSAEAASTIDTAATTAGDADSAAAAEQVASSSGAAPAAPPPGVTPTPSPVPTDAQPSGLLPSGNPADQAPAGQLPAATPSATPAPPASQVSSVPTGAPSDAAPSTFSAPAPSTSSSFTPNTPSSFAPGSFDQNASAGIFDAHGNPLTGPSAPGATSNWWDKVGDFEKAHPALARAALSGAGGLLQSLAPTPLNKYYNAQTAKTLTDTQIAQMRAGITPGWWYGPRTGG